MLVVADSSPFVVLVKIDHVDVLPKLYGSVVIPTEVAAELSSPKRPLAVRKFIASAPSWLTVQAPARIENIIGIDEGERSAISLAQELKADILLIDEAKGREAAIARNIRTLRTTAMLLDAAMAGAILDLRSAFEKLQATNFRVKRETLHALLARYEEFRMKKGDDQNR